MTKVINIWGGPGTGKSTTAAAIFYEMKKIGLNVELVTEVIKDYVWEQRTSIYADQLYILAKQNRRVNRLVGQVDWVITDSPLLLGMVYRPKTYFRTYDHFSLEVFNSYNNHNFLIGRDFEYQPIGRNQTANEALEVDQEIQTILDYHEVPYTRVTNNPEVDRITQILNHLGLNS